MTYCHKHNLVQPEFAFKERNFGIRVALPENDTFTRMLGDSWEKLHWYRTETERDQAFETMSLRHGYYRKTDSPTQVLTKISR